MAAGKGNLKQFLCHFAQEHTDLRIQELKSIISGLNLNVTFNEQEYSNLSPFLVLSASYDCEIQQIADRSVLIKGMYQLFGRGESYDDLERQLKQLPPHVMEPYSKPDYTFSMRVKGFNKKLTQAYMVDAIEWLSFLPFAGRVSLENPMHEFHILEEYKKDVCKPSNHLKQVFFCKVLSLGQRHLIKHYSLKTRHFIGNTSMDAQLSLIMANMAKVSPGKLVYDPFAGSGSILVASAHYGGYVFGSDIDWNIVHGRGKASRSSSKEKWRGEDESVRNNLSRYSLEHCYVDMLVSDISRSVWREQEIVDAIITDPPYGIREGLRRIDDTPSLNKDEDEGYLKEAKYNLSSVIIDLLGLAARVLVVGGRLVYWLPFIGEKFDPSIIPRHPALSLVSMSEQPLSRKHTSRWLITMEKSSSFDSSLEKVAEHPDLSTLNDFRKKYFS